MPKTSYMRLLPAAIAAVMLALLLSCTERSGATMALDRADSIMEQAPDSALSILLGIDSASLAPGEERARYALLMSMALDKNYIDTADDSLINIAESYYSIKSPSREMMLSSFYKARVRYNAGRYGDAIRYALSAADEAVNLGDTLWTARANEVAADIYARTFAYDKAHAHREKSAELYRLTGRKANELYAKGDMALELSSMKMHDVSAALIDSLLQVSYAELQTDSVLHACLLSASLRVYNYAGMYDKAIDAWHKRICYSGAVAPSVADIIDGSYAELGMGNLNEAKELADMIPVSIGEVGTRANAMALRYSVAMSSGDIPSALSMSDSIFSLIDSEMVTIAENPALEGRGDFHRGISSVYRFASESSGRKVWILAWVLAGTIALSLAVILLMSLYRRRREAKTAAAMALMTDTNGSLTEDKKSLSQKLTDISREKDIISSELESVKNNIRVHEKEKMALLREKNHVEGLIATLVSEKDRLSKETEAISVKLDNLKNENGELTCSNVILAQENEKLMSLQDRNKAIHDEMVGKLDRLNSEVRRLQGENCRIERILVSSREEKESLSDKLDALYSAEERNTTLESLLASLYMTHIDTLNSLSVQILSDGHVPDSAVRNRLEHELRVLRDRDKIRMISETVNMLNGGIIDKVSEGMPDISESDMNLLVLSLSGLSGKIIAVILGMNLNTVYTKRRRLYDRISKANIAGWETAAGRNRDAK